MLPYPGEQIQSASAGHLDIADTDIHRIGFQYLLCLVNLVSSINSADRKGRPVDFAFQSSNNKAVIIY